jgi:hypothetical protein
VPRSTYPADPAGPTCHTRPSSLPQAFGNAVLPYLPGSFVGPTWAVRMSEFFALLQVVGCYQVGRWWCLAAVAALGGAVRYAGAFAI